MIIFVGVSTGHFPPPTTPEELGARILIQERYEKFGESEEVEMEVESEDEDDEREETRTEGQPPQPSDQDTQVQDMDEVSGRWNNIEMHLTSRFSNIVIGCIFNIITRLNHDCFAKGSDEEDEGIKAPLPPDNPMPPPLPPTPDQVIIRKDYDPKGMHHKETQITSRVTNVC